MDSPRQLPSDHTVREYFTSLSNWGRWGADDELGAFNFVTPQKRIEAAQLVRSGRTVGCSRLLARTNSLSAPGSFLHFMLETGEGWTQPGKPTFGRREMAKDFIGLEVHGLNTTHIDSLGHFFQNGRMYNGSSSTLVSANRGATHGSVDSLQNGLVTRGVLLDIAAIRGKAWLTAGEAIFPDDLLTAERHAQLDIEPGDAIMVRTGHSQALAHGVNPTIAGTPGVHAACLPWLHERQIAVLATDSWTDVDPSGYTIDFPVHRIAEVAMGVRCIDSADFELLAAVCQEERRWEFMLCLAPLRLQGATGSPLNPIATF